MTLSQNSYTSNKAADRTHLIPTHDATRSPGQEYRLHHNATSSQSPNHATDYSHAFGCIQKRAHKTGRNITLTHITPNHFKGQRYIPMKKRLIFSRGRIPKATPTKYFLTPPRWIDTSTSRHDNYVRQVLLQAQQLDLHSQPRVNNLDIAVYIGKNLYITSERTAKKTERRLQKDPSYITKIAYRYYLRIDKNLTAFEADQVIAYARTLHALDKQRKSTVACLASACLLHGVPLYTIGGSVHLWVPTQQRAKPSTISSPLYSALPGYRIERYSYRLDDNDITYIKGRPVTTIRRTLIDVLLRFPDPGWAVSGDALFSLLCRILHMQSRSERRKVEKCRKRIRKQIERLGPVPGKVSALKRLQLLNPLAGSAGESVTRLLLHELGFRKIHCQVPVYYNRHHRTHTWTLLPGQHLPRGTPATNKQFSQDIGVFYVDIVCEELNLAIEFDGKIKYFASDRHVIYHEKEREAIIAQNFLSLHRLLWNHCSSWQAFVSVFLGRISPEELPYLAA
ncbi:MAG: hypothetical protein Q4P66_07185 [Actinomycetaceae bacterium]|nr:hypothetical protein [Actinomycetaceae bacterium]